MSDNESRVSRGACALAAAVALVAFAILWWRFRFLCDDAYISFRYARNLAEGHGLVFNLGVDPPVEGYSEFLWVLLLAAGMLVGVGPEVLSLVLSGLCGLALVALTVRMLARRVALGPGATLGAALVLGTLPPLAVWASSGLATVPFALAVLVLFDKAWGDSSEDTRPGVVGGMLASAACVLLRADGAFWVAAVTGPAILVEWKRRELLGPALRAAAFGALTFGLNVAWRSWTYGDWLPNTARAKLGLSQLAFERGGLYLGSFALVFPGLLLAVLLGLPALRARRLAVPALGVVVATLLYAVMVGGDFMAFGRFLIPALPFAVLLLGAGLGSLEARGKSRLAVVGVGALIAALNLLPAFNVHVAPRSARGHFNFRHNGPKEFRSEFDQWDRMREQALEWKDLGKALVHYSEPGDSIVFPAVGAIGYFSRLFVYDCNGLVTREVALRDPLAVPTSPGHDKTVLPTFFLKDRPTFLAANFVPVGLPIPPAVGRFGEPEVHELGPPVTDELEGRVPGDRLILVRPK